MSKKFSVAKIVVAGFFLLLTPVLVYSLMQFIQRSQDEAVIRSIYERQLSSLLFSVNQHCWDHFRSWHVRLTSLFNTRPGSGPDIRLLQRFVQIRPHITAVFIRKTGLHAELAAAGPQASFPYQLVRRFDAAVERSQAGIEKMLQYTDQEYVQPVLVPWETDNAGRSTLLVFPIPFGEGAALVGLVLDDLRFIQDVLQPKLTELAAGDSDASDMALAVRDRGKGDVLFSTENHFGSLYEKREALWILLDADILIKLRGTTLDAFARKRIRHQLMAVFLMNAVFGAGLVILFRNLSKEMTLSRMKTDFVANVSHELRTPLSLIRMYAETLEMKRVRLEAKKKAYYKTIIHETERLTHLINNILDFSRIESNKKEYRFQWVDLAETVKATLDIYTSHLAHKGFAVETRLDPDLPAVIADRETVVLSFMNLLDNAVKFSPNRKKIVVGLVRRGDRMVLSVRDFGIGIPASEQKKIFEKFYRAESSLVHNTKGSGLGLSLVKQIMEKHGGEVRLQSHPGKGSTFSLVFRLPAESRA